MRKVFFVVLAALVFVAACGPVQYSEGYRECLAGEKPAYRQPSGTMGGAWWPVCQDGAVPVWN